MNRETADLSRQNLFIRGECLKYRDALTWVPAERGNGGELCLTLIERKEQYD